MRQIAARRRAMVALLLGRRLTTDGDRSEEHERSHAKVHHDGSLSIVFSGLHARAFASRR